MLTSWRLACLLVVSVLLPACGGGGGSTAGGAPPVPAGMIGAAGGTVTGPGNAQVVIPAGALTQNTAIAIAQSSAGAPPLPADMPVPMKLAAYLSHLAFYGLMIALPLLGYGMLSAADYPVVVFGVRLPSVLPHSNELHTVLWNAHRFLALCFFALIVVHLAAALFHALVRRDGVFQAMAPWR